MNSVQMKTLSKTTVRTVPNAEAPVSHSPSANVSTNPAVVQQTTRTEISKNLAVRVKNVSVKYGHGQSTIFGLKNASMNVPTGCIYGLLGPSGCGKTTLLRCILGCLNYKSGEILIYGYRPGSKGSGVPGSGVGYMPQDIALHEDLTIEEMLTYFGRLSFIRKNVLNKQINELIKLMDLPAKTSFIGKLSGGQKRRASFACAVIHRPRLLILDEPTVGVDPLLRERIWSQLVYYTKIEKISIIITTHYIEETRRADYVGFMRKGKLLAEDEPKNFMNKFQSNSLEKVFYKLCMKKKEVLSLKRQFRKQETNNNCITQTSCNSSSDSNGISDNSNGISDNSNGVSGNSNGVVSNRNDISDSNCSKNKSLNDNNNNNSNTDIEEKEKVLVRNNENNDSDKDKESAFKLNGVHNKNFLNDDDDDYCLNGVDTKQGSNNLHENFEDGIANTNVDVNKVPFMLNKKMNFISIWCARYFALLRKYFLQRLRRPEAFVAQFILPLICLVIFCVCIGGTPANLKLAIINEDYTCYSTRRTTTTTTPPPPIPSPSALPLIKKSPPLKSLSLVSNSSFLNETSNESESDLYLPSEFTDYSDSVNESLFVTDLPTTTLASIRSSPAVFCLSELLIESMNSYIFNKINYTDEKLALKHVKDGKLWGMMKIRPNFSTSIVDRLLMTIEQGDEESNFFIEQSSALIRGDMTSTVLISTVSLALDEAFELFVQKLLLKLNYNVKLGQLPIVLEKTVFGEFVKSDYLGVRDFGAPGLIIILTFSISYSIIVLVIILELRDQMFERNYANGITTNQILFGHLFLQFLSTIIGTIILLNVAIHLFDVPCRGSQLTAFFLLLIQSVTGMTMGLFISSICPTLYQCTVVSNGILILNFIISGVLWSKYTLPYYMRIVSLVMPTTLPVESLRCILTRGLPFTDYNVYIGFIVSFVWLCVFFISASIIFKNKK